MTAGVQRDLGPLDGFHDYADHHDAFLGAVLDGLGRGQRTLPCKYFYDAYGSRLFDRICELDEYYVTRTELSLLETVAPAIAGRAGPRIGLVEFGSGSSVKVRLLLDTLNAPAAYVPVDISREHLLISARGLAADYPALAVVPVCADYTQPFALPELTGAAGRLGFFPGSTIGNFDPAAAATFLAGLRAALEPGSGLVVGADLAKDPAVLCAAYDDAEGVTAAFNLNLLRRINRELGADFDLSGFTHEARWNAADSRIEMHLVSRRAQTVSVAGRRFPFAVGESIHTENSYKYSIDSFQALAARAGWTPAEAWTDPGRLFSVHYLEADG